MTTETEFKNDPMSEADVAAAMTLSRNGIRISDVNEGEQYVALGLLTDEEMRAAVLDMAGDWVDLSDLEDASITQGWAPFTRHQPECKGLFESNEPDMGPCSCLYGEYAWWYGEVLGHVAEANAKRPGAIAVTELRF